jgi:hypothetical protein
LLGRRRRALGLTITPERSLHWTSRRHCRGKVKGDCDEGYPRVHRRGKGDSSVPIVFQIIVWDGEKLTRIEAMVSTVSTMDGKPDWFTDNGSGVLDYISYSKVAAWASLNA